MYVVLVEFVTRSNHAAAFVERVRQQARDSLRNESGCHVFDVCINPERANFVMLYEVYTDRAAFDAHLESAHFRDFDAAVRDWITDKKLTFLERLEEE